MSQVAQLVALLVFFACEAIASPILPAQTPWQKELFRKVSEEAAKLSAAARPGLLKRLDSAGFRKELATCCPSMSHLPAEALLQKLHDATQVAEVASGFPAESEKQLIFSLLTGMSIDDGLRGTYFQNQWQHTIIHNESFDGNLTIHTEAECSADRKNVTISAWEMDSCAGTATFTQTYETNQCFSSPMMKGMLVGYACEDESVVEKIYNVTHELSSDPVAATPCPPGKAQEIRFRRGQCTASAAMPKSSFWQLEDDGEMSLYGAKPFTSYGHPASIEETRERGVYALVNQFHIDQGSPLFGDISAVFSLNSMKRTALISAIDTGFYESSCNTSRPGGGAAKLPEEFAKHNCSEYPPFKGLGTFDHFYHLFLINDNFWYKSSALVRRFARLEGQWGSKPLAAQDLFNYWEAMPAGTMEFPQDIRFLIGNFGKVFGSANGERLREWCLQRGWVLVWALGPNFNGTATWGSLLPGSNVTANQRLVDPLVASRTTAAPTLPTDDATVVSFQRQWFKVKNLRSTVPEGKLANTTAALLWHNLTAASPAALRVSPLRDATCKQLQEGAECVGISGDGRCVCYAAPQLATAAVLV